MAHGIWLVSRAQRVQGGVYLSPPWPVEVIAMAMMLEQQKLLEWLLGQLAGAAEAAHGGVELQSRMGPT
jgi:hypothetical protein